MKKTPRSAERIRIIAGFWRSRRIEIALQPGLRPSTDRIRETVFNWLNPFLEDATVCDLFAGTGILGLEACSRGAREVIFIEKNPVAFQVLQKNIEGLRPLPEGAAIQCIQGDALQWLKKQEAFVPQLIFLDPPFDQPEILLEALDLISQMTKKSEPPIIYVESNAKLENSAILERIPGFAINRELVAGVVKACVLMRHAQD